MPTIHTEEIPLGTARIKAFTKFPQHLYKNHPLWTPPLQGDLTGNRLLSPIGLLTPEHPYQHHAEVTHFLVWKNGKPAGRISASINKRFNDYHSTRIGFFGFFQTIDDYEVGKTLLDRARAQVKKCGIKVIHGPGEYSNVTHERQGILIDGFQCTPTVELTHNPPYYSEFLEQYSFRKAKYYHAYILDVQTPTPSRLVKLAEQVRQRRDIETRPLHLKNLHSDVRLIVKIYNESCKQIWGFLPLTNEGAIA